MRTRGVFLTSAVTLAIVCGASWGAFAEDGRGDENLVLQKTIDVGLDNNGKRLNLGAFDISFVDPKIELYVLADRTNASVDLFNSEDPHFIGRVGSLCPAPGPNRDFCFQGVKATTSKSGPDGVVIVDHKEIWPGDGDSEMKIIDIATGKFIKTISTGGQFRVDEMAFDPRDHLIAAANNADDPPFVTVFDTIGKTAVAKLVFKKGSANADVDATNGIEQPQWSPVAGLFYISVPQVGTDPTVGGVSVIDPIKMTVLRTLKVKDCNPAGLALGPNNEALIGCSGSFGTAPNLETQSLIIDITDESDQVDHAVVKRVPIGGSDEVWFDRGTRHYFLAARNNLSNGKPDPILGSIDATTNKLDPAAPTSTTAHSAAADQNSNFVFVPIGLGTDPTNPCQKDGCIAVFRAHSEGGEVAQRDDHH